MLTEKDNTSCRDGQRKYAIKLILFFLQIYIPFFPKICFAFYWIKKHYKVDCSEHFIRHLIKCLLIYFIRKSLIKAYSESIYGKFINILFLFLLYIRPLECRFALCKTLPWV